VDRTAASGGVIFERIAPVVPVLDLEAAQDRYRRLGFDVEPLMAMIVGDRQRL
jgi:hypothetical protein